MGSINWSGFDWQAFSTLATGLAAVIGATIVGFRQTMISKRQNEILERQTELEELKLKSDLYDRRMDVYSGTTTFLMSVLGDRSGTTIKPHHEFSLTIEKSRFLFRPSVTHALWELARSGNDLMICRRTLAEMEQAAQCEGEGWDKLIQESQLLEKHLSASFTKLPQIFGHELQLGARDELTDIEPGDA